ncbi:MAG TPA: fibronectin type III domain-containing protein [Verrucomicrobiae bacterium]|nr:fibronectin type III domain-containing protein [Verrucomicrobiae bacterium]HEV2453794.1 fibronectin type III domain-containing protein [Verrucomicrobiae bacterium]
MNCLQVWKTHFTKGFSLLAAALLTGCSPATETNIALPPAQTPGTGRIAAVVSNTVAPNTTATAPVGKRILPIELTAKLVDPVDIDLNWKCHIPHVAGYIIDFNMGRDRMFEILDVVFSNVTAYQHRNLMPNTRFAYRIRPFFGKPSNVVRFTTGEAPNDESQCDDVGLGMVPPGEGGTNSLRNPLTEDAAAPTDLTVRHVSPRVVDLNWKDNAKDADGYLVEYSMGSDTNWHVAGVFKPHAISFRVAMLPPDTKSYFRVRAFYVGAPSLAVQEFTGAKPTKTASSGSKQDVPVVDK